MSLCSPSQVVFSCDRLKKSKILFVIWVASSLLPLGQRWHSHFASVVTNRCWDQTWISRESRLLNLDGGIMSCDIPKSSDTLWRFPEGGEHSTGTRLASPEEEERQINAFVWTKVDEQAGVFWRHPSMFFQGHLLALTPFRPGSSLAASSLCQVSSVLCMSSSLISLAAMLICINLLLQISSPALFEFYAKGYITAKLRLDKMVPGEMFYSISKSKRLCYNLNCCAGC